MIDRRQQLPCNGTFWREIFLFFMLISTNVISFFIVDDYFPSFASRILYLSVSISVFLVGILLLPQRLFFVLYGLLYLLVMPVEISSLYLMREPVSAQYMDNILSTDFSEATELLSSMWIIVLFFGIIWGLYVYLLISIPNKKFTYTKKFRLVLSVLLCSLIGIIGGCHAYNLNKANIIAPSRRQVVYNSMYHFVMTLSEIYPFDIYIQSYRAYRHHEEFENMRQGVNFKFGIAPKSDTIPEVIVLVIGEAGRYDNFSLNGLYPRQTCPLLSQKKNLLLYHNAYAQANLTLTSVPLMLTRAQADNYTMAFREGSLVSALKEAGFYTALITAENSPIAFLTHLLPVFDFTWINSSDGHALYDGDVLQPLKNLLDSSRYAKKFILIHTKGSHFNYAQRYPDSFAIFTPDIKKSGVVGNMNKEHLINAYDNSILYTDYVLASIISILEQRCPISTMIYMPDHGENLCDDERQLYAHGTINASEYEYHVPLIIWYSNTFASKSQKKVQTMQSNINKKITSDVLFYTICDIADMEELVVSTKSLCSPLLIPCDTFRVLNGKREVLTKHF